MNCFSMIPFALIQSGGRPDITAKLHLIELPLYLVTVWALTKSLGIEGTAIAWTLRVTIDAVLLFGFARVVLPAGMHFLPKLSALIAVGLSLMYVSTQFRSLAGKSVFLAVGLFSSALGAWIWGLDSDERAFIQKAGPKNLVLRERIR